MNSILKPYTIVPSLLYVQRDADRQVRNIVRDMGRPGYVLVSRQMGKTNLLLNAKRELQNENDIFVYIDLSNTFDSVKSCFENIIDTAIETHEEKFFEARNLIEEKRDKNYGPPHKQHTNELITLLKSIKGKLVIILDEIDALTKTDYSDQIFSQIRSIYFSRVNYPDLERLTYLLSGVVEPSEIIKDPKISPFNIGEKIYLNDFSKEEFNLFVEQAKLALDDKIKNRIFYWTNGNPRMTWDLCSEVEKVHNAKDIETVDAIVKELYLTTFDKPPIDNIRELVKKDRDIRDAIIEIGFQKGNQVSDKIKNKLYLAGIINFEENSIQIKNRIINESLSHEWIGSIEKEEKGLLRVALELINKEQYDQAFGIFEEFLEVDEFEEDDKSLYYYYTGLAAYKLSKFEKSIFYLTKTDFDKSEDSKWFFRVKNLKGLCYYFLNKIEESLNIFKEIIDEGRIDENYTRALLNYGSILLKSDKDYSREEAVKIFEQIINEEGLDLKKIKEPLLNQLKSIAYYNLALIQLSNSEVGIAKENLNSAISLASNSSKPIMYLALYEVASSNEEKHELLTDLVDLIVREDLQPSYNDPDKPIDFDYDHLQKLLIKCFLLDKNLFFDRISHLLNGLGEKTLAQHVYELGVYAINNESLESGLFIIKDLYQNRFSGDFKHDPEASKNALKLLAYLVNGVQGYNFQLEYVKIFKAEKPIDIDFVDLDIFANIVYALIDKGKYNEALVQIGVINSVKSVIPKDLLLNYLVIDNLELNIYLKQKDKKRSNSKALEILQAINKKEIKPQKNGLLGEKGLEIIKENAESVLKIKSKLVLPVKSVKRYSRNDTVKVIYKDGSIRLAKFKKVEEDIKGNRCDILD